MTTYSISAPDGKTYEIDGPAGATQEQIQNEVMRQNPHLAAPAPIAPEVSKSAWDKASKGDIVAGLPATRMIAGLAAPVVGAAQVGANIGDWIAEKTGNDPVLGEWIAKQVQDYEEAKKRGMAALGETGPDMMGLGGSAITGGAALKGVTPATTYVGKVLQGGAIGAAAGATTPSSTPGLKQTAIQTGAGTVLGGAIPAVAPVFKAGYNIVEPMFQKGQEAIKQRALVEAAGDRGPEVLNALRSPGKNIVPGSMPTAGEAAVPAGSAEFAALQKSASKALPSEYLARADANKAAQINQLRTVGGTEADLGAAEASRHANALVNYAAANNAGIDQGMADALKPQITELMSRPVMRKVQRDTVRWAKDNSIDLAPKPFVATPEDVVRTASQEAAATKSYTVPQKAAIQLWGDTMYLDHASLPRGPGHLPGLAKDFQEYSKARSAGLDHASDLSEWFAEGASKGKVPHLTREAYDVVMSSAEQPLKAPLVVYRSGTAPSEGWVSTSTQKGAYSGQGAEVEHVLPAGTKVIFANGLADNGEIILNAATLGPQTVAKGSEFGSVEGLDYLKKTLDRQIKSAAAGNDAKAAADLATLLRNKEDLLATLKEIAPAYDVARSTFAAQSAPINQMRVGQYLENKLVPALGEEGKLRAASFAGAVRDAPGTLRKSLTNAPRFQKLTQVLDKPQMDAVNSVVDDLARGARFEDMAKAGGGSVNALSMATESIGGGGSGKLPGLLSRTATVANLIIARAEGKLDKKLALELAKEMLSPARTAVTLRKGLEAQATNRMIGDTMIPGTVLGVQSTTNAMQKRK